MPTDMITDSMAQLGLLTGALALAEDPNGILYAVSANARAPYYDDEWSKKNDKSFSDCSLRDYLSGASFERTSKAMSELLAWVSIHDAPAYLNFLADLGSAPAYGHVLLRPVGNVWPDAAKALIPWAKDSQSPASPADRCFPAIPLLNSRAVAANTGDDIQSLLPEAGTDILIRIPSAMGNVTYVGWNSELWQTASVTAVMTDFSVPWKIVTRPDGSEDIMPAHPLRLASAVMNCYEDMAP